MEVEAVLIDSISVENVVSEENEMSSKGARKSLTLHYLLRHV